MSRVAAIDCGTNSIRLLVADVDVRRRQLTDLVREMRIVRLGEGVDATGRMSAAAIERTLNALRDYVHTMRRLGAGPVRMVATSASRDAANRDEFLAGVREILGSEPEVLGGADEAGLSFAGATAELDRSQFPPPYLVVDIGGGSTEFVLGDETVAAARSVDIGCVRLTERRLRGDPPAAAEVAAARADIETALGEVARSVPVAEARTVIGLAGSVTTVAALALDLPAYDPARIHLSVHRHEAVHQVTARLLAATRAQRAGLPVMHPGRVDVIAAGALVLDTICERFAVPAVVASEHDILDGIAWSLAGGPVRADR
jgi:exopolyphosphatase/guanosine-5'-triphosphate,3'-diphosphate pyrophosphatase